MPTPEETLDRELLAPASASNDGQSVSARSISDTIQGLNYKAAVAAIKKRRRGLYFSHLLPAGALDECGRPYGGGFNGCGCGGGW